MKMPLIEFKKVTFGYHPRNRRVLCDFSSSIRDGTASAVLGPNGVGKTTLIYLALGWLRPQSGNIILSGKSLNEYNKRERGRWMSLVPQQEHVPFEYSLLEYVMLGRAPYLNPLEMPGSKDYHIAEQSLDVVGLSGVMYRSILELSAGERQLLLMARALTQQPRIILLDEPTSHLDLNNKKRLINLLKDQVSNGVTVFFTTHEPEVAVALSDQVVLIREGKVLYSGPVDRAVTSDFLSTTYDVPVKVVEIDGKKRALWI
jgi:iron complex transport system ATP-binding protein